MTASYLPDHNISFVDFKQAGYELETILNYGTEEVNGQSVSVVKDVKLNSLTLPSGQKLIGKEMFAHLELYGFNSDEEISVKCKHRHRAMCSKAIQFNYVITGKERIDQDWLESGAASQEAHMRSKMKDFKDVAYQLANGNRGGY